MDRDQARDASAWPDACTGPAFISLKLARYRLVRVLMVAYLASYLGLAAFCGFARSLAGLKVLGPMNLGYTLIIGDYVLAWVLALVYFRSSSRRHDALARTAIAEYAALSASGKSAAVP